MEHLFQVIVIYDKLYTIIDNFIKHDNVVSI